VIYVENNQLFIFLSPSVAFSQCSDFKHMTVMAERRTSYEEKCLTEDEISAELLAETLSDVPEDAESDS
jgi:hypothetical protein